MFFFWDFWDVFFEEFLNFVVVFGYDFEDFLGIYWFVSLDVVVGDGCYVDVVYFKFVGEVYFWDKGYFDDVGELVEYEVFGFCGEVWVFDVDVGVFFVDREVKFFGCFVEYFFYFRIEWIGYGDVGNVWFVVEGVVFFFGEVDELVSYDDVFGFVFFV